MQSCFFFCFCAKTSRKECNATFFSFFAKHQFPYSYVCARVFLIILSAFEWKLLLDCFCTLKFREGYFSSQVDGFPMFSGKQRLTRLAQNCKYVELYEDLSQFFPYKGSSQLFSWTTNFCEAGHSWESIFPCHLSWCLRKILKIYRVWFQMLKQCPSLLVLRHEGFAARRKLETGQRFTRGSASNCWSTFQMGA